ncbi:MAG: FmdB family zinc ribbon protein [Gemmatimonadota bacterium]
MPTYAYECGACGHVFDVFAKITAKATSRKCPVCGARAHRQITGGAGFLFKGEGFYITDYRSEEYRSKEKAEKGSGTGDGEGASDKGDKAGKADASPSASDKPAEKPRKKDKKKGQ